MGFAPGAEAIKAKLIAEWPNADVPLYWANDNSIEDVKESAPVRAFMHIDIVAGVERPMTRGAPGQNRRRQSGEIVARIFTEAGKGTFDARRYADDLTAIFRDQIFSEVHCDQGSSMPGGTDDDRTASWFQFDVIIPFTIFFFG